MKCIVGIELVQLIRLSDSFGRFEAGSGNHERIGAQIRKAWQTPLKLAFVAGMEDMNL